MSSNNNAATIQAPPSPHPAAAANAEMLDAAIIDFVKQLAEDEMDGTSTLLVADLRKEQEKCKEKPERTAAIEGLIQRALIFEFDDFRSPDDDSNEEKGGVLVAPKMKLGQLLRELGLDELQKKMVRGRYD